jgi:hypothetical protein
MITFEQFPAFVKSIPAFTVTSCELLILHLSERAFSSCFRHDGNLRSTSFEKGRRSVQLMVKSEGDMV